MILLLIIIALGFAALDALPTGRGGCSLLLKDDLGEPQPLVLVKKGLEVHYVNPIDTNGRLYFEADEEFRLACIGDNNFLVGVGDNDIQDIAAFCKGGKTFSLNSIEYQFKDLKCNTQVSSVVRRTGETCLGHYAKLEIGFDLGDEFLSTIEVCRDEDTHRTFYTKFHLTKTIGNFQSRKGRPSWRQADFWGTYDMSDQYKREVQKATVTFILNSTELGNEYVTKKNRFYSRGHLTAMADFVYGTARRSTFWYVNAQPQWQSVNGGNWNILEGFVRDYAKNAQLDLDVYTGTHGVLSLTDNLGEDQPLYLYATKEVRAMEIPSFFWKIIYDPISQKGTAFVSINNPYIINLTPDHYICEDISSTISYVKWLKPNNISLGVSYACRIDDLRKVVSTLPELTVLDVLA